MQRQTRQGIRNSARSFGLAAVLACVSGCVTYEQATHSYNTPSASPTPNLYETMGLLGQTLMTTSPPKTAEEAARRQAGINSAYMMGAAQRSTDNAIAGRSQVNVNVGQGQQSSDSEYEYVELKQGKDKRFGEKPIYAYLPVKKTPRKPESFFSSSGWVDGYNGGVVNGGVDYPQEMVDLGKTRFYVGEDMKFFARVYDRKDSILNWRLKRNDNPNESFIVNTLIEQNGEAITGIILGTSKMQPGNYTIEIGVNGSPGCIGIIEGITLRMTTEQLKEKVMRAAEEYRRQQAAKQNQTP